MTEEEKKELNSLAYTLHMHHIDTNILFKMRDTIQKQQEEIEKKDKIIDLTSEKLAKAYHYKFNECSLKEKEQNNIDCDKYKDCTSCVKQYFQRKVEV